MKIGENIKKFRKEKGLTQKELADKLGKSIRIIQKYESGDVEPSIEVLNEIAKNLGTDFLSFIELEDTYLSVGYDDVKIKPIVKLTKELLSDIISGMVQSEEIPRTCLVDDDFEFLAKQVKKYIIEMTDLLSDKNLLIMNALQDPEKFHENYFNN